MLSEEKPLYGLAAFDGIFLNVVELEKVVFVVFRLYVTLFSGTWQYLNQIF